MSKITVTEIAGQTSGSDQNLVKLPSNNTLQVDNIVNRSGDNDSGIDLGTNDVIRFKTANAERMRLDAGGSILLGQTTPTDLHNTWNHLIMGNRGSIISQNGGGGIDGMTISYNAYIDSDTGAYAYIATDEASILSQQNGNLKYQNAVSGTAGNGITFNTKLEIDSAGRVSMPSQPAFYVKDLNFPSSNNAGVGTGGTVEVNIGSNYATGTGRFTAPIAGNYYFFMMTQAYGSGNTSGQYQTARFYKNGSAQGADSYEGWSGGNNHAQANNTIIMNLAAGDYVQAYVIYGSRDIQNFFGGHLIG
tara:strand:+ start:103 stop:1014 length:912 start_codon:yes stop_codon:yes gene_type:complete